MPTTMLVNLPVKDLATSVAFFTGLGFTPDPQMTDDNAACMVVSEQIYVMLLVETFFKTFTRKDLVDATQGTEAIVCLGVDSRERVDELADTALTTGGTASNEPMEYGFMYGRSFQDPDGHLWEVVHMAAAPAGPQATSEVVA